MSTEGNSRRRAERGNVNQRRLRGVFLKCARLGPEDFRVLNVSESGLGIETSLIKDAPPADAELPGLLTVGKAVVPIVLKLVHMNTEVTGFAFMNISDLARNAIRVCFEAEIAGASLRQIGASSQTNAGEELSHAFRDDTGNGVEFWTVNGEVRRLRISVLGNEVEWTQGKALALLQNNRRDAISEYMRNQLLKFVTSAHAIEAPFRAKLETILTLQS